MAKEKKEFKKNCTDHFISQPHRKNHFFTFHSKCRKSQMGFLFFFHSGRGENRKREKQQMQMSTFTEDSDPICST